MTRTLGTLTILAILLGCESSEPPEPPKEIELVCIDKVGQFAPLFPDEEKIIIGVNEYRKDITIDENPHFLIYAYAWENGLYNETVKRFKKVKYSGGYADELEFVQRTTVNLETLEYAQTRENLNNPDISYTIEKECKLKTKYDEPAIKELIDRHVK